ncbi:DUF1345 domain-containing protein [Compostibacter hankyongensis]|uniref:DUF1345 domain-containing protein n=1 Tax=Compostibacter hankyongensis TaxID=1007089 RepID=A0ABP8FS62_9BACT
MPSQKTYFINRLTAVQKLILSIGLGVIAYFIFPFSTVKALPHIMFAWDIFCVCLLVLTWITFYTTPVKAIRQQARRQDDSRVIIFFLVLIATCTSMLAVFLLLISQEDGSKDKAIQLPVAIACMLLSWFLVHTIFTSRYAHMYYADHATLPDQQAGGLEFPEEPKPDFVDFAYFSFTLGMTFQVSDVEISSRHIRRLALWHGLLSFGYNATIIALTVNIVAGLTQG